MRRVAMVVLRLLPIVIGASVASIIGLCVVRNLIDQADLRESNNEVGNYLQAVGTVYAVLLAFVVQSVWSQFNEARMFVEREATEVVDLFRTTDGLPDEQRHALQTALQRYTEQVVDREWRAMAKGDEDTIESVGRQLDGVWAALHGFEPSTECEKSLHAEALSRFNDLSDARTSRLTSSRTRMPFGLKLLLYIGAFIMVGSMYLIAVKSFVIHAIITGALAGAVSHILYLVADLDDAFSGLYHVSRSAFLRARRQIERPRTGSVSPPSC